jgi:hypothetical protein
MHQGARQSQCLPSTPLFSSLFLASITTLLLWADILQVAAAPASLPRLMDSSPFANRMQAEANAVALTCTLLLPQHAPAPRIAAFVLNDISGGLEYSLRQFCLWKVDKPPVITVHVASFSSRVALRTSLLLQRLSRRPHVSVRTEQPSPTTGESCCQPSSDLEELSFVGSHCECSIAGEPVIPPPTPSTSSAASHNLPQTRPIQPSTRHALSLFLDVGPFTQHRIRSTSTALSPSAEPSSSVPASVRLVELQWDMQTGNFIEGSLDIISAAINTAPGHPQCLSALMASGNRCLQVYAHVFFRALSQYFRH